MTGAEMDNGDKACITPEVGNSREINRTDESRAPPYIARCDHGCVTQVRGVTVLVATAHQK